MQSYYGNRSAMKKASISSGASTLINFRPDAVLAATTPSSSLRFHHNRKSFWSQLSFSYLTSVFANTRRETRRFQKYLKSRDMSANDDDEMHHEANSKDDDAFPITSEKDIHASIEAQFEQIHPGMLDMQKFEELEYHDAFVHAWRTEQASGKPSLFRALVKAFWREIAFSGALKGLWGVLVIFCAFYLVREMISHLERTKAGTLPEGRSVHFGHVFAAAFFIGATSWSVALQQMTFWANVSGIKMRGALAAEIFRKSLSSTAKVDNAVNLIAKDCQKVLDWAGEMHFLWSAPIEALAIIGLLLSLVGVSATAAFGYLIIALGILAGFGGLIAVNRKATIRIADERIQTLSELLTAIKIIKYYVWEESFVQQINEIRKQERRLVRFGGLLKSINLMIVFSTPPTIALILFGLYVGYFKQELAATLAFTTLSMFNILRLPLVVLPKALKGTVECLACLQRIQTFLLIDDFPTVYHPSAAELKASDSEDDTASTTESTYSGHQSMLVPAGTIAIEKASFAYPADDIEPIISNFSMHVAPGSLFGIAGAVASGKSTIINAILGECLLITDDGVPIDNMVSYAATSRKRIGGPISYAPQTPWIQRATVRDNIIFGQPYDSEKFETVVRVCGLEHDLKTLPNGADTWIEERGANLSGGQRQRVSLARAVYRDAAVYLLDDVLSAIDPRTAELIVNECFFGYLKKTKNRTVILVTHDEKLIRRCDRVLVVEGRSGERKCVANKVAEGEPTSEDVQRYLNRNLGEEMQSEVDDVPPPDMDSMVSTLQASGKGKESKSKVTGKQSEESQNSVTDIHGMASVTKWIKIAGAPSVAVLLIFIFTFAQASRIGSDYWIRAWVARSVGLEQVEYIYAYMGFVLAFMALMMVRGIGFYALTGRVSYVVHKRAFRNVMYAPLSFFHKTPVGVLLNAFSSDLEIIEETMPDTLHQMLIYAYILVSIWILVSVVIPQFMAVAALLLATFAFFAMQYLPAASAAKSIVGASSNEMMAHVSETISGLPTLRAFGAQGMFRDRYDQLLARFQRNTLYMEAGKLWISFRCDILAAALSYATATFSLIFGVVKLGDAPNPPLLPSDAGLAISNALQMLLFFSLVVKGLADVKAQWSAFDRIYTVFMRTSKIRTEDATCENSVAPQEVIPRSMFSKRAYTGVSSAGLRIPAELNASWPVTGSIEFRNVYLRYNPSKPAVLKDLNFSIKSGEKVGVCGRTGSGKSSTLMALLRMEEIDGHPLGPQASPELPRGQIFVDGVDVGTLPLHLLRKKIATIPQEPVMFKGTVRTNLDPFGEYSDQELWEALGHAHLRNVVEAMTGKLDAVCEAQGANWSLGQRQLLCLARVLLRKPTILLLDEATSAMDATTDSLIQETIRTCFADCTTITIAHRLDTVIGLCDKIMILHDGKLIEFDEPMTLLANPESQLAQLVAAAGPATEARLKNLALESYSRKTQAIALP